MEPKPQPEMEQPQPDELNEDNLENVSGGLTSPKTAEPISGGKLPTEPVGRPVEPING